MAALRRSGSPWRILVHEWLTGRKTYGTAHNVSNDPRFGGSSDDTKWEKHVVLPGTEFDELVIGHWIHLEQMGDTEWWMNIGGVTVWVTANRDGRPTRVAVYGPRDYDAPVDGCVYHCEWTEEM